MTQGFPQSRVSTTTGSYGKIICMKRMENRKTNICKNIFLLALCVTILAAMAGCGSSAAGSASGETETESFGADETTLVIAYPLRNGVPEDNDLVEGAINEIVQPKLGVKIRLLPIALSDYSAEIQMMLSSGEKLDAFVIRGDDFNTYLAGDMLMDLTDLLETDGQGIRDAVGGDFLSAGEINGRLYAVTTNRDLAVGWGGLMCRTDIMREVGYTAEDIHTLDDLDGLFAAVHKRYPEMICVTANTAGESLHVQLGHTVDPLGDGFGVLQNYGFESLEVVDEFETDEYREYCEHMRRWYKAGYISPDIVSGSESGNAMVKDGFAFSYVEGIKPGIQNQESRLAGMDLTPIQVGENATYTSIPAMYMWAIPYSADAPELSMRYLNEQYTNAEIMNLLAWGIEGVHYDRTSDGHITRAASLGGNESGYSPEAGWLFGNQFLTHVWEGDDLNLYDRLKEFNGTTRKSLAFGFTFDNSSVIAECAAVENVYDQYKMGLECGLIDPATGIPEMVQAMKNAGLDRILEEKQAQLDAWVAGE